MILTNNELEQEVKRIGLEKLDRRLIEKAKDIYYDVLFEEVNKKQIDKNILHYLEIY